MSFWSLNESIRKEKMFRNQFRLVLLMLLLLLLVVCACSLRIQFYHLNIWKIGFRGDEKLNIKRYRTAHYVLRALLNVECRQEIWFKSSLFFCSLNFSHLSRILIFVTCTWWTMHLCRWLLISVLYLLNPSVYASFRTNVWHRERENQEIIMMCCIYCQRPTSSNHPTRFEAFWFPCYYFYCYR